MMKLKKSEGQMSALAGQLNDKATAFTSHVNKLEELKAELDTRSAQLAQTEQQLKNQKTNEDDHTAKMNEIQSLHKEQCQELQQQLELLGQRVEQQSLEVQKLQESKSKLQREVNQKEERLAHLQSNLTEIQKEVIKKTVENQQLWNMLQNKADEGTMRMGQMEAALVVCKQELAMHIKQLEEMKKKNEQEMKMNEKEVGELEERWHKATAQMEERGNRAAELEQALRERQKMLQESAERISELEDREGQLEHQVSGLAKELSLLHTAAIHAAEAMEKKLHQACLDLEDRSNQLREMTQSLGDTQSELKQSREEARDLEQKLREARRDGDNQGEKTSQLDAELHSAKVKLDSLKTTVQDLEGGLERTREESKQYKQRGQRLDTELEHGQEDLRAAADQLGELHRLLQRSKADAKMKHERVQELNDTLRKSQDEMRSKERDIAEMDTALRTSQRELLQRSAQVSQLDVAVKERQSEMERQILQLETSLNKIQYQLKQSKQKNSDLEERCEKQQQATHVRALHVQQLEQTIQRQNNDVALKVKKATELEKRKEELTSELKEQKQEYLERGQQLRLSREQMQQSHVSIAELQRQLAQAQRQQDNLSHELDDALEVCNNKDSALARLAEELGAARAQELALQAQYTAELQQIATLRDAEVECKDDELTQLQESHARLLAYRDQLDSTHRLDVSQLRESEVRAQQQLKEARSRVTHLEADLAACKEVIEAANEAIVIKESEIARLKARVSGYERTFGAHHGRQTQPVLSPGSQYDDSSLHASPTSSLKHNLADVRLSSPIGDSGGGGANLAKVNYLNQSSVHTTLDQSNHRTTQSSHDADASERLATGDYSHSWRPAMRDSTTGLAKKDYSPLHSEMNNQQKFQVKFDDRTDAFSDVTETNSGISGIDRLPDNRAGTFQAMLEFVNRKISAEKAAGPEHDTSWLNLSDSNTDSSLMLTPTRSSPASVNLTTSSFSPPSPLKSANNTPSRSAPTTPSSPRRKSGIPHRKRASPGRRILHFPRGVNGPSANNTHGRKQKGGKVLQPESPEKDKHSPETTPLKQKLANQRAKLASRGKTRPVNSSQLLKPKECIADLQEKIKNNDMRRLKIDEELFSLQEKTRSASKQMQATNKS